MSSTDYRRRRSWTSVAVIVVGRWQKYEKWQRSLRRDRKKIRQGNPGKVKDEKKIYEKDQQKVRQVPSICWVWRWGVHISDTFLNKLHSSSFDLCNNVWFVPDVLIYFRIENCRSFLITLFLYVYIYIIYILHVDKLFNLLPLFGWKVVE